jgi:hypothetical protein
MSHWTELNDEVDSLQRLIAKLHVTAWRHRVNKNTDLMRGVHRRIKAAKKRIVDCEWMMQGIKAANANCECMLQDAESWLPKAIASWFVFQIVVISFLATDILFAFIQTFVCLRFNCILPWFSKGDVV